MSVCTYSTMRWCECDLLFKRKRTLQLQNLTCMSSLIHSSTTNSHRYSLRWCSQSHPLQGTFASALGCSCLWKAWHIIGRHAVKRAHWERYTTWAKQRDKICCLNFQVVWIHETSLLIIAYMGEHWKSCSWTCWRHRLHQWTPSHPLWTVSDAAGGDKTH